MVTTPIFGLFYLLLTLISNFGNFGPFELTFSQNVHNKKQIGSVTILSPFGLKYGHHAYFWAISPDFDVNIKYEIWGDKFC